MTCFAFALIIWQVIIRTKHKSFEFLAQVICLMKMSSLILIMKFHTRSNCNINHLGISLTFSLSYYWGLYFLHIINIYIYVHIYKPYWPTSFKKDSTKQYLGAWMKLYVTLRFDDQQHARKFEWQNWINTRGMTPYVINTHHHSGKKTISCKKRL